MVDNMTSKRVQINPGCGYWDTTIYGFGGSFRRADDGTIGQAVAEFRHKGLLWTRIKLDDGRTAVAKTEYIEEASNVSQE